MWAILFLQVLQFPRPIIRICHNIPHLCRVYREGLRHSLLFILYMRFPLVPKMPPHSEFVRAFNVAQFFELWAGSAEHILGTKREPTTQWMRPRDVEGLLRQDCESLASHAAPDDTTHSVTQGLCEIEARCIDLANALLQPILDTKIRRQAEVELTKQQAWEVVHLQAKDMGLTFNDAIVTLMNDFVAWMILAWK